jgi:hypothetical protein
MFCKEDAVSEVISDHKLSKSPGLCLCTERSDRGKPTVSIELIRTGLTTLGRSQPCTLATIFPRTCPPARRSRALGIASNVICSVTVDLIFPSCSRVISSAAILPKSSWRRRNAVETRTPPKPISCRFRQLNGKPANASGCHMHEHNVPLPDMQTTVKRGVGR